MENNNENTIDSSVRQALENLAVPYQANHWTKMAEKLDALDAQDADFDTQLKSRLDTATTPNQPSRWDLMAQQLDVLDNQDTQFDNMLRERVEQNYAKYQPKHWDIMSRRLDEEFSWKAKIMRYKVAEVGILLLLIFTVFNYLDTEGIEGPIIPVRTETPAVKNTKQQPNTKSFNQGTNWNKRAESSKSNNGQSDNTTPPPIVSVDANNGFLQNNVIQNTDNPLFEQNSIAVNVENNSTSKTDLANHKTTGTLNNLPIVKPSTIAVADNVPPIAIDNTPKNEAIAAIEPIGIARTNALSITYLLDEPSIAKRKSKWWTLGVFTSGTLDKVSSSYMYKFVEKKWSNWSVNKGAGFTISKHKGKVELETGVAYHQLKYNTDLPSSVLEGRIITGQPKSPILTKSVELGLVQLPVSAKIHSQDMGKWNIYASLGVTANAAFHLDTINFAPIATRSVLSTTFRSDNETQFPEYGRPFLVGINKNDNNFYFTANAGVGVEYRLNPLTSLYIQPQIEYHILNAAIGTRKDRINTLSVQAGVKMRMGVNKY
jgi:Outer membrane protein beta-barrel domain